jgi:hypothetical protein
MHFEQNPDQTSLIRGSSTTSGRLRIYQVKSAVWH